ncbi:hypothetical protein I3I95_12290 [bacterium]|nr:hypothetical protein [bacterium]
MSKKMGIGLIVIGCLLAILAIVLRIINVIGTFALILMLLLGGAGVIIGYNLSQDKED